MPYAANKLFTNTGIIFSLLASQLYITQPLIYIHPKFLDTSAAKPFLSIYDRILLSDSHCSISFFNRNHSSTFTLKYFKVLLI